jgi:ABC-type branched-subunit amino acid transport system ATPase component
MPERLIVSGLSAGYRPGMPILKGVSVAVAPGEILCLIGPNGAGKSTLVKAVAGIARVESGAVALDGADITRIRPDRLAERGVAYVPQTANVFTTLTVGQNLALAAARIPGDRRAAETAICARFPLLAERRGQRAGGLSGGQRQILALAMALVARPSLVLMDEPTAGLSPRAAQEALALIREIAAEGVSVLLVEQNARAALRIADRGVVLADGRVAHEGPGAALLSDPAIGAIYLGARPTAPAEPAA